jgi:hypothetical protein
MNDLEKFSEIFTQELPDDSVGENTGPIHCDPNGSGCLLASVSVVGALGFLAQVIEWVMALL